MRVRMNITKNLLSALLLGVAAPATAAFHIMGIGDACAPACFYPERLTIDAGDTVSFYLFAEILFTGRHNVVADDGSFRCARGCDGEGGDGTPVEQGFGFSRVFATPGRVGIHDEVSGARAEIIVLPRLSIGPGFTGSWYDPAQSGHGLFLEVLPGNQLVAAWLTFDAAGNQAWFVATGSYSGYTAMLRSVDRPSGGRWIPNFDPARITHNAWGSLVFTFTDCDNGRVDFFSSDPGFGNGGMTLKRLTMPAGVTCQ
jgi:plastocyanin